MEMTTAELLDLLSGLLSSVVVAVVRAASTVRMAFVGLVVGNSVGDNVGNVFSDVESLVVGLMERNFGWVVGPVGIDHHLLVVVLAAACDILSPTGLLTSFITAISFIR